MGTSVRSKNELPSIKHLYQNAITDSIRWNFLNYRDDDIIVTTSYKAGTTWMQMIVANLIFSGRPLPSGLDELSPWVDFRIFPLEKVLTDLNQQTHRRVIKTHLPLDGQPYDPRVKYIYVGRDARDVFMSMWNHYSNFTDHAYLVFNTTLGRVGDEFPRCPDDIHEFWRNWMTKSWFEWESDGYPWWSHLHHAQSWWDFRHLPNILFVHYKDLLADLEGEIRRIAGYLNIEVPASALATIVRNCTFAQMKAHGSKLMPVADLIFKGGSQTFFNKGTNGRWKDILSAKELELYDAAALRALNPDCRRWLEGGGHI
jgi:aryl sulfotransferase